MPTPHEPSSPEEADVHQLVGFLAAYEPPLLTQLQQRHPGQALLRPGRTLGRLNAPTRLRVELAQQALQAMVARGDMLADRLARRLRTSHRVELVAQLVALGGSGGVLAALWGEGSAALQLSSAALGLAGSATAVAVKFLRRDLGGTDNGLVAQHAALVKAVAEGVELEQRLAPHVQGRDDFDDPTALATLLERANALAGQVYLLMKQAGAPAVAPAGVDRP